MEGIDDKRYPITNSGIRFWKSTGSTPVLQEHIETAEEMLFSDHVRFGEPGWMLYTDEERKRLMLLARSMANGKGFCVSKGGKA